MARATTRWPPCSPGSTRSSSRRAAEAPVSRRSGGRTMLLCSVKGVRFGEEVGDLLGEVVGTGAGKADGGDDASVAAPQPDEPGLSRGPSSGGGRAGVDLDGDGWHGWSPYLEGLEREDAAAGLLGCGQDREGPL